MGVSVGAVFIDVMCCSVCVCVCLFDVMWCCVLCVCNVCEFVFAMWVSSVDFHLE